MAGLGLTDHKRRTSWRPAALKWAVAAIVVCGLAAGAFFVASLTPVFTVTSIEADPSSHLTAENISKLAAVPEGTTLLNVDANGIAERLSKNPWVASVSVDRVFPDKLRISVKERDIFAVVLVSSGNVAWYLSDDGTWVEPAKLAGGSEGLADQALALARQEGCLLIRDVPSSVSPKAGAKTTDAPILGVIDYQKGFTKGLADQVVSYSASSEEAISCVLQSGIEVSLGDPSQISSKEAVVNELLAKHPNELTYINVRNPSKPSFRRVESGSVSQGTGVQTPAAGSGRADAQQAQSSQSQTGGGDQQGGSGDDSKGSSQGSAGSSSEGQPSSQNE
ncbi:FtsQ-type POTRA domain-containing protein [Atopobiaceae bacterium 24-176]